MKTKIYTGLALMMSAFAFSQAGIGTVTPQATLDVVGKPTDAASLDGIIAPRMEGAQLRAKAYTASQTGALVYVTLADTAPAGQTADVTAPGYYFFNGSKWLAVKAGDTANIYNSDGALTDNRTLDINGKSLDFQSSNRITTWDSDGRMHIESTDASADAVLGLHGGDNTNLYLQQWPGGNAVISASGNTRELLFTTSYTADAAPIRFSTSAGGNTAGQERMRITGEGNVGINTYIPTEKLDVNGIMVVRELPLNGATNAHHTIGSDNESPSKNQTFTANRTLVVDANGVVGYVSGLPNTSATGAPSGSISVGETVSQVYSVPAATASSSTFNLGTYVTANSLPALPVVDGLQINLQGNSATYYDPRIYNTAAASQLISYQSFATQVNENETSLNNNVPPGGFLRVDDNEIVFWTTGSAEVETTNVQVQVNANTYRWYEFKWWCMEIGGAKKIFLSISRKA